MVENKKVMAKNILYYMNKNDVTAADICKACGFKQNTFSDWVNGKIYPRIDKIEKMAAYFHISKSNLVEERQPEDTDRAKDIRSAYLTSTFKLSDDEVELIESYRLLDETGKKYTRNFVLANPKIKTPYLCGFQGGLSLVCHFSENIRKRVTIKRQLFRIRGV